MRAVVKTGSGPGYRFVTDRSEPELTGDQLRIEVEAASVCGTDAALVATGAAGGDLAMSFPRTLGHEAAGTVIEIGPDAHGWAVGTRVALETHLHCGACWFCRAGLGHNCAAMDILGITVDGAFAERLVVRARCCVRLPDHVPTTTGALLESAGSAMHAVLRSGLDPAGTSVLVCGGGPVGLAAAQIVAALGARDVVVTEPSPPRRELAARLGLRAVDALVDPREVADARTRDRGGFDLAVECSGATPALRSALGSVRREATVVAVGLQKGEFPLSVTDVLITRGVRLCGSWGRSLWETWYRLIDLVAADRVDLDALVTHRLPLSGLGTALELMRGDAGKVLLLPSLADARV